MMLDNTTPKAGEKVEIFSGGVKYRGILVGITETEVFLKAEIRMWTIPIDRIQSIQRLEKIKSLKPTKNLGN